MRQLHYLRESTASVPSTHTRTRAHTHTHTHTRRRRLISFRIRIEKMLCTSFLIKAQVVMTEKWNNMEILIAQLIRNAIP